MAAHEQALKARSAVSGAAPLDTWAGAVLSEWIDYNGHMTEHRYLQCFGEATDALLRRLGVDADYLAAQRSFYTVESHLMHLGQAKLDAGLAVETQVLSSDAKRLQVFHVLKRTADDTPIASAEQMLLHVDTAAGRAIAAEGPMLAGLTALAARHAALPRPAAVGRFVGAKQG